MIIAVLVSITSAFVNSSAFAQQSDDAKQRSDGKSKETKNRKPSSRDSNKKTTTKKFSAGRERMALKFVKQHHPELSRLLSGLKANNEEQYRSAILDLLHDRDRLLKINDSQRHDLSLELWKLNSRLRLEVARFSIAETAGDVDKLVDLMRNRNNVRVKLLSLERERLSKRTKKIEGQIETLRTLTTEKLVKDVERLRKSVAARAKVKAGRSRTVSTKKPPAKID